MEDSDYCMQCGCSDIASASIDEWERMYTGRYGHRFVERHGSPVRSRIMGLSVQELKRELLAHAEWREVIRETDPTFKCCLPKFDTVSLFFERLCREKRLDELREKLIKKTE